MIVIAIAGVICLTFGTAQTGEVQIIPDVKISLTSLQVTDAEGISKVTWRAIAPSAIYCVSEHPTVNMYFDCPDCDPKVPQEKKFMDQLVNAKRLTYAKFPLIVIGQSFSKVDVNGRINGKHLRCNANYTTNTRTNQESNNDLQVKSVLAELDIKYMDIPVLVDESGIEFADTIYLPASGQDLINISCIANGNPVPQAGHLIIGETKVNSLHSSVKKSDANSVIQCFVYDDFNNPHRSKSYVVKLYDVPVVIDTRYKSGDYSLNQHLVLECSVKATPQPTVIWKMITGGKIKINAACDQYGNATGHENISTQNPLKLADFHVTSTCRITMDSYFKTGKYYCEGCLESVKDSPICHSQTLPNETANIVIHGKPVFSDWISVTRLNSTTIVEIVTQVCANPNPHIYWIISGRKIIENKTVDNFYAHSRVENATYPNCYAIVLEINLLALTTECESVVLVAINNHSGDNGVKKLVDVRNKLMPLWQTSTTHENDIGNPTVSILAISVLIAAVVVAVMFFRRFKIPTLESQVCNADQKNVKFQNARQYKPTEIVQQETRSQSAGHASIIEGIGRVLNSVSFGLNRMSGRNYRQSESKSADTQTDPGVVTGSTGD